MGHDVAVGHSRVAVRNPFTGEMEDQFVSLHVGTGGWQRCRVIREAHEEGFATPEVVATHERCCAVMREDRPPFAAARAIEVGAALGPPRRRGLKLDECAVSRGAQSGPSSARIDLHANLAVVRKQLRRTPARLRRAKVPAPRQKLREPCCVRCHASIVRGPARRRLRGIARCVGSADVHGKRSRRGDRGLIAVERRIRPTAATRDELDEHGR